jgi:hypothetical protein
VPAGLRVDAKTVAGDLIGRRKRAAARVHAAAGGTCGDQFNDMAI